MNKKIISIIGSGGKTSVMLEIANKLKKNGNKVALTTTTKIYRNMNHECIDAVCDNISEKNTKKIFMCNNVVVFGEKYNEKLIKPSDIFFEYVLKYCDYLIIESDGSKQKPLKITNKNEPVVLENSDEIIAVFGLSAIGQNSIKVCHRSTVDTVVDIDYFCDIIQHNIAKIDSKKLKIILNQADTQNDIQNAIKIREKLQFMNIKIAVKGIECEF